MMQKKHTIHLLSWPRHKVKGGGCEKTKNIMAGKITILVVKNPKTQSLFSAPIINISHEVSNLIGEIPMKSPFWSYLRKMTIFNQ